MLEVEQAGIQMAGHSPVGTIRASMRGEAGQPGPRLPPDRPPRLLAGLLPAATVSSGQTVRHGSESGQRRPWRSLLQRGVDTAGDRPGSTKIQRRHRSACPAAAPPPPCIALGSGIRRLSALGLVTALLLAGLVYVAAGDYHRHGAVTQAIPAGAIAASLPLAALPGLRCGGPQNAPAAATGLGRATRDVGAGRLERGFFSLLGVMGGGAMLPADEIRD